jgi:hypothetical protein
MLQSGTNRCEVGDKLEYFLLSTALKEWFRTGGKLWYCTLLHECYTTVNKLRHVQFIELKQWYLIEVSHSTTILYSTLEKVQTEEKLRYSIELKEDMHGRVQR